MLTPLPTNGALGFYPQLIKGPDILKLAAFNYAAIILILILLLSIFMRKMTKGISNKVYLFAIGTVLVSALFDTWAIHMDNTGMSNPTLMYIAHFGYLLFHNLTTPAYVAYIISTTDSWRTVKKSKPQLAALCLPFAAIVVCMIVNTFTDSFIFSIQDSVYVRGPFFFLLYASAVYYALLCLIYLVKFRKQMKLSKFIAIAIILPLVAIAVVIQFLHPDISVEMFACALSLLFISMTAQRPEDHIDVLTGLNNHSAYIDSMKYSFNSGKKFTTIIINMENYSALQAMLGIELLKTLLMRISSRLTKINKSEKLHSDIYYLDSGRFRVVLREDTREKAELVAHSIISAFERNIMINELTLNLTAYVCVVNCPEDTADFKAFSSFGSSFQDNAREPNVVLYAKNLLKKENFDLMSNLDSIIENALQNHKFKVYYQPIYSVEQKRFTTAEALLRLIDDDYGFIPPDIFITAAEKSGAIHRIGEYVLDEVCRFISSDRFKRLGLDYIEINLSVAQCMHGNLAHEVLQTLRKHDISSDKINLEITETAASYSQNTMQANMNILSSAGISFSLDDYGTGYSNIRRVVQLPLKIVKLDKSFADELNNPKMWVVLKNTVKMLKDMNMEIVVEGIETQDMAEQFSNLKCDYIQGYYFSKPIPENDFVEFITKSRASA